MSYRVMAVGHYMGAQLDDCFRVVSKPDRPLAFLRHSKGGVIEVGIDPSACGWRASGSPVGDNEEVGFFGPDVQVVPKLSCKDYKLLTRGRMPRELG
ncbi:hypothetical protein ACLOJK_029321 [Asimina triloba]